MFSPYIAYLRVSTKQQADEGISLDAQKRACIEGISKLHPDARVTHALYDGDETLLDGEVRPAPKTPRDELHVRLYQDAGVSGAASMEDSKALTLALNRLPKGGVLVVAKLDRLDRDDYKFACVDQTVTGEKKGRILSIAGEGTEGTKPYHLFMRDILKAMRKHERLMIKERTRTAVRERKAQGLIVGQIPRGYSLCIDGEHLEPRVVSEWEVVNEIVSQWKQGKTFEDIAASLAATPGGYRSRNGRFLAVSQIYRAVVDNVPNYKDRK